MGRKVIEAQHTIRELFNMLTIPEVTAKVDFSEVNQRIADVNSSLSASINQVLNNLNAYKTSNDAALKSTNDSLNAYKTSNNKAVSDLNDYISQVQSSLNTYKSSNNQAVANLQSGLNSTNTEVGKKLNTSEFNTFKTSNTNEINSKLNVSDFNSFKTSNQAALDDKASNYALNMGLMPKLNSQDLMDSINFNAWTGLSRLVDNSYIGVRNGDSNARISPENLFWYTNDIVGPRHHASRSIKRNLIRGGTDLGGMSDYKKSQIRNGTFEDMYLGDHFTINGHSYYIIDFDYYASSATSHTIELMLDGSGISECTNMALTSSGEDSTYEYDGMATIFNNIIVPDGFNNNNLNTISVLRAKSSGTEVVFKDSGAKLILPSLSQLIGHDYPPSIEKFDNYGALHKSQEQFAFFRQRQAMRVAGAIWTRSTATSSYARLDPYWEIWVYDNGGFKAVATGMGKFAHVCPIISYNGN